MSEQRPQISRRRFLQAAAGTAAAYGLGLPVAGRASAALPSSHRSQTPVVVWNDAALQAIREVVPGPPITARALAVLHTAIYDAWAAYDSRAVGTRLGGGLRRPTAERTDTARSEAVSFAAYRALTDLFPGARQVAAFDALMARLGYDPSDQRLGGPAPSAVGNQAARMVLDFRHGDGSNQLGDPPYSDTTGYRPVNSPDQIVDPNRWQPLRVQQADGTAVVQQFIAPHWGGVVPFAIPDAGQLLPPLRPALFGDPRYRQQAEQILRDSAALTDRHKVIAEYWADGPRSEQPPGHWTLLGRFVSARDRHTLRDDVVMFFALANALLDASIACWYCKRLYDYVRPVTAVHHLFGDQIVEAWAGPFRGPGLVRGGTWRPYQAVTFVTPPFAEFTSGHSTFSAAAAEILRRFTGNDRFGYTQVQPAGVSFIEPGLVPASDVRLTYGTFSEAADEAGLSRRYGGIHFEDADLAGREVGRRVGGYVWRKAMEYVEGRAAG
jgi:hypothetical protein